MSRQIPGQGVIFVLFRERFGVVDLTVYFVFLMLSDLRTAHLDRYILSQMDLSSYDADKFERFKDIFEEKCLLKNFTAIKNNGKRKIRAVFFKP